MTITILASSSSSLSSLSLSSSLSSSSLSYLIRYLGFLAWRFLPKKKKRGKVCTKNLSNHDYFCVNDDENLYLFFFFFLDEKRKKKGKISERIIFLVQFKFFVFVFF